MNRRRWIFLCLLSLVLLIALPAARAALDAYSLDWWTVDSGGGVSSGGSYTLSGTAGQAEPGAMRGGSYSLVGGFWAGIQKLLNQVFVPLVVKH